MDPLTAANTAVGVVKSVWDLGISIYSFIVEKNKINKVFGYVLLRMGTNGEYGIILRLGFLYDKSNTRSVHREYQLGIIPAQDGIDQSTYPTFLASIVSKLKPFIEV